MPGISNQVADALDRGWHYATLLFGETQIRTGHLLVAMLKSIELRRALIDIFPRNSPRSRSTKLAAGHRSIWAEFGGGQPSPDGRLGHRRREFGRDDRGAGRQGHDRARSLQPGSHRQGQVRRHGPDPRPRRGNPPDRRRADAPAPEQSDPHRRGGRRQDRGRRGLRAAHRLRRRAAAAARRQAAARSTSA